VRHRVHHRKLGRKTAHRIATLRTMASALFEHERIQTTLMKAKELRPFAEKLITLAKRDEGKLHARRQVAAEVRDDSVVKKLFDTLGQRFSSRPGGYTRILRLGPRKGDGAEMAIVELIGSEYKPEKKVARDTAKTPEAKAEKAPKAPKAEKAPKAKKAKGEGEPKGKPKAGAKGKAKKAAAAAVYFPVTPALANRAGARPPSRCLPRS
jgi:large subunit ribosomal protein L17